MNIRGGKYLSCYMACIIAVVVFICYIDDYLRRENNKRREELSNILRREIRPTPVMYIASQDIIRSRVVSKPVDNITTDTKKAHNLQIAQIKERLDFTLFKKHSDELFKDINREKDGEKLVLLWNPIYKSVDLVRSFMNMACPSSNCVLTDNKAQIKQSDAVFFEAEDLINLPKKKPGQVWIYSNMEAPAYQASGIKQWDNLFNWTMTYRRDSDIEMIYGAMKPLGAENKNVLKRVHHYKQKDMVWFVSKCKTPGLRERHAEILNKTINIDIIGKCGKNLCPKQRGDCYDTLRNETYKFFYAAENSNCRDYISEKSINSLNVYSIPIVRGGANYSIHLPPHSFIDDSNFSSPDELAKFVIYVGNNRGLYDSYFQYKKYYYISKIHFENVNMFCEMCYRLNHQDKYRRLYKSIKSWWYGNGQDDDFMCRKGELPDLPG